MRTAGARQILVAACGVPILAACGSTAASSSKPPSTPIPVQVFTPAPTLIPTPQAQPVGQTVQTTTNAMITVEQTAPAHGNEYETPPPGGRFLGAKIKECAGDSDIFVSPTSWNVKLADATQIDGTFLVDGQPGPDLMSTDLQGGSCTEGWVYFPLPHGAQPKEIHLQKADFFWTL